MNLNQSLYAELAGHAGLAALVGVKIYKGAIDQEASLPAITFERVSMTPVHASGADASLTESRVQISVFADTVKSADAVAAQVVDCLRDFSGLLGTTGVNVQRIFIDDRVEMVEVDRATNQVTHHTALDFIVWAEE